MKKKNGFTLIELLAVIVILAIILVIVLPKIFNNISNSTEQFYKEQESILKEATLKYLNNEYIDSNTSVITIKKEDLINAGYISEIYDVNNGNSVCDATIIVYSLSSNPKIKVLLSCENYNSEGFDETYLVVNLNEGSTSQIFEEKYTYGTKITLINPTKAGYTFTGWTVEGTGASLNGSELTTGIETTTITANWERNYVTLTVNLNEGSTTQTFNERYYSLSTLSLTNPTRVGYEFTGWTVEGTGASISGTELTIGTSNTTITANWQRNTVTLTVNLNEGSITQTFNSSYLPGTTLSLTNPTRSGYEFTGWTVEGTGASINGTELTIGTSDTTITANWEEELVNPVLSYSCYNAKAGSSPYVLNYTGNCTVIDDGDGNWRVKFLTRGTLTTSSDVKIDVFLVGGGAGGKHASTYYDSTDKEYYYFGKGGCGGYTTTEVGIMLESSNSYDIEIGAGGTAGGGTGGNSTAFGITAQGGTITKGGSGGGDASNRNGASDGNSAGGTGQGTTTREFAEPGGDLYAGGGGAAAIGSASGGAGGGGNPGSPGTPNTGGGGGSNSSIYVTTGASAGGSGIVVIRNSRSIQLNGTVLGTYNGSFEVVDLHNGNWKIRFLSSGKFIPAQDMTVDAFLVGGGGGGKTITYYDSTDKRDYYFGIGGGGGYTTTEKNISLTSGTEYNIVVGLGGTSGNSGGKTSAFEKTAQGGGVPNGGSGGGNSPNGSGASDGNSAGGTGQGTTTREFGELDGDLYAGGGGAAIIGSSSGGAGGGGNPGSPGTPNTGGGGGSNSSIYNNDGGKKGGSGIVIIRNASS